MATDFRRDCRTFPALAVFAIVGTVATAPAQQAKLTPSSYASIGAVAYAGPGRASAFDLPGPIIRIGLLAPLHGPEKADGEAIVRAARMALREASQRAFPGGQRLELAIGDESGPSWGHTSGALLHLVSDAHALAVITSANGTTAHLSEQVGNKIGVPVLTLSTDPTTTEIDLPWIFRLGPSDSLLARTIAQDIYRNRSLRSIVLVAERDHDGRVGSREFQKAVQGAGVRPIACVFINPLQPEYDSLVAELGARPAGAIVLWTRSETAGNLVERLQRAQVRTPIYL
jgi:ABC-type branched-subunit amino acid transport system substrate-binding protein